MTRRTLEVTRAHEAARNRYGATTYAYYWEFPLLPGAHQYEVVLKNQAGGISQIYQLLKSDIEQTANTTIPILTSNDPFPPAVPAQALLRGDTLPSFYRRGTHLRYLLVWGSGFNPNTYYDNHPIHVVAFEE